MTRLLITTQNGKPVGESNSPAEFEEMRYKNEFIESITRGLSDSEHGNVVSSSQIRSELKRLSHDI